MAYMAEFLYAGNNTNEELRSTKSNQNIWGNPLVSRKSWARYLEQNREIH